VHSRSAGVDPQTASLEVLLKVPNLDVSQLTSWVAERDAALRDNVPPPPIPFSSPFFSGGANAIRISAEALGAEGVTASRDATVRIGSQPGVSPQFYLWQKNAPNTGPANATPPSSSAQATNNG
jgi:hypothetical protein